MKSLVKTSESNLKSYPDRKKKTEKADLESKKGIFFQIGLIIALSIALYAFEWKSYDKNELAFNSAKSDYVIDDLPPITNIEKPEPKIEKISLSVFKAVENTKVVKEITPLEIEVNPYEINEPYTPIVKNDDPEISESEIFKIVQQQPTFIGGESALFEYLRKSITYPNEAREIGIQGIVYISFVIEKDGSASNITVARGIGGGCDEEAARVIKAMPKWNPGLQRDKPVRVQFNVPIRFTLSN